MFNFTTKLALVVHFETLSTFFSKRRKRHLCCICTKDFIWVRATWLCCRGNLTPLNFSPIKLKAPAGLTMDFASYFQVVYVLLQFSVQREISEMRRPMNVKFCTVISTLCLKKHSRHFWL